MILWLVLIDCAVMSGIAFALLWIKKYQEGILGNAGFAMIIFASVVIWFETLNGGDPYEVDATAAILITGMALFMCHHLYRYCRYYHFAPTPETKEGDVGAMHAHSRSGDPS